MAKIVSRQEILDSLRILELPEGADRAQIKAAYKDLAAVWHPDRYQENPRLRDKAEEKLKTINHAYDLLKHLADEDLRQPQRNESSKKSKRSRDTGTYNESNAHLDSATQLVSSAREYLINGSFDVAAELYRQALDLIGRTEGRGSAYYIEVLLELLGICVELGFVESYITFAIELLDSFCERINVPHKTHSTISNFAQEFFEVGMIYYNRDDSYASRIFEETLTVATIVTPIDFITSASAYFYLGKLSSRDQSHNAISFLENALSSLQNADSKSNYTSSLILATNIKLADIHLRAGSTSECEKHLRAAFEQKYFFDTHLLKDDEVIRIWQLCDKFPPFGSSATMLLDIVHLMDKRGAGPAETSKLLTHTANALVAAGRIAEARPLLDKVIAYRRGAGDGDMALFTLECLLAGAIAGQGHGEESDQRFEKLMTAIGDTIPDSPELAHVIESYSESLRKNKRRLLDAANLEAKAKMIRKKTNTPSPTRTKPVEPAGTNGPLYHGHASKSPNRTKPVEPAGVDMAINYRPASSPSVTPPVKPSNMSSGTTNAKPAANQGVENVFNGVCLQISKIMAWCWLIVCLLLTAIPIINIFAVIGFIIALYSLSQIDAMERKDR